MKFEQEDFDQWRAGRVLVALEPLLRIKRRQAQLGLLFLETFRHTNVGRNVLPASLLDERRRLSDEIATLNNSHWLKKRLAKLAALSALAS